MRRNIELYIGGQLVDLGEQSLILMNYTHDDLNNPTIIKNSYSQQIEIEGTPNNDKIFGGIWRFDRKTISGGGIGIDFDAAKKTPFLLFNGGECLESGYMKLDSISIKGQKKTYKVSLYGGLGNFLYSLSYNENGEKMSLSDLNFGTDLTFTISKETIIEAWDNIGNEGLWGIINFAPCYNGYPDKMDADKMVVSVDAFPFETSSSEGEGDEAVTYSPRMGNALFKYNEKITEWEAQELRSWMQRPVVRLKALLSAIARSSGYGVSFDTSFFNTDNPYIEDTWMTLPLLSEQTPLSVAERTQPFSLTIADGNEGGRYDIQLPLIPSGTPSVITCEVDLSVHWQSQVISKLYLDNTVEGSDQNNIYILQLWGYDANGAMIASSEALYIASREIDLESLVNMGIYPPLVSDIHLRSVVGHFAEVDNSDEHFRFNQPLVLEIESDAVARLALFIGGYSIVNGEEVTFSPKFFSSQTSSVTPVNTNLDVIATGGIENETLSYPRSFSTITQDMILKTERTPADYLVSVCKMFGLSILVDDQAKQVKIIPRASLFNDSTLLDIDEYVDTSKGMSINPYPYVSKWYALSQEMKGEFVQNYYNTIGRIFGEQRIDTGYDFSAEVKQLLSNLSFAGAAEVLESSKLFGNYSTSYYGSTRKVPAAVLLGGTYSLYNNDGGSIDLDIIIPNGISGVYFNANYPGYDGRSKVQFHEAENKPIDGKDVLLFFRGSFDISQVYQNLRVSDDSSIMSALNEGKPCWTYGNSESETRITHIPYFSRYQFSVSVPGQVSQSLDFGIPAELGIPGITIAEDASLYAQFWKNYLADRFDDDSKVLTCYVNLQGLPKGYNLLRRFVYFNGAIWCVNKVINQSLTSEEVTQVELIKVQQKENYI